VLIRFGPAAAPRWFNQDIPRFRKYLDLIEAAGGTAIEFVVLPGQGTEELGRVHLLPQIAIQAIAECHKRGVQINLHGPLTGEFRLSQWATEPESLQSRFRPVFDVIEAAESGQETPPVVVLHAADDSSEITADFLAWLSEELEKRKSRAKLSLELRARSGPTDERFDRSLTSLVPFLSQHDLPRAGICWDVAHDWENGGQITALTPEMIRAINHVHIHDRRSDGEVHAPLGRDGVPWQDAISMLTAAKWTGSITLEIRYRYAMEQGEPWNVLEESLRAFQVALAGE
jgi:sugar phosphate isomerase/epimerase